MPGMGLGLGLGLSSGGSRAQAASKALDEASFEVLLQVQLVDILDKNNEGAIVRATFVPWLAVFDELNTDPKKILQFADSPDKFEEFIAASYEREGWERVTLTPRSGDGGRDVIAEKGGFGAVQILDQCKAFRKGHLVGHNDVRAMLGVLHSDPNATKAIVSTSSDFAPGVKTDEAIQKFVPNRLELRNGKDLIDWLKTFGQPE